MMLSCRRVAGAHAHISAKRQTWMLVCCALLSIVTFGGCGGPEKKLIGVWRIDSGEELAERMTGDTAKDRLARLAGDAAQSLVGEDFVAGRMEVEFMQGGKLLTTTTVMNTPVEKQGTWVLEKIEGDVITVRCQIKDEQMLTRIRFESDDTIHMIPPNINVLREEFRFKRAK